MITAFQPNLTPLPLLATASAIIAASQLPFTDDHDAAVEIVARALGKFGDGDVDNLIVNGCSQATATEIVYTALELAASDDDDSATVEASASPSATMLLPTNSANTTDPDPTATPMLAMLTMIKEIILPVAEHMTAQEAKIVEISARLSLLEAGNSRL